MEVYVVACYMPIPGKETGLREELQTHVDILLNQSLATDAPFIQMRSTDGTVMEVFEWTSQEAIATAHTNPVVLEMWKRFEACSTYIKFADLPESELLYAAFSPLE